MRWARFATVFSLITLPLWAVDEYVRVSMDDGGTLKVPIRIFHDVEVIRGNARGAVFVGFSEDSQIMFAYTRLNHKSIEESPLFDTLSQTMLLSALERRGLQKPTFNAMGRTVEGSDHAAVYSIEDPGGAFDQDMIVLDARTDQLGMGVFMLIGTQSSINAYLPLMLEMMRSYSLEITRIESSIPVWVLVGAVLVVMLNLAFVWFGFNRLSHMRHLGIAEQG